MTDDNTQPQMAPLKGLSDNLYNMWRCVVCIAHADGIVQPEERQYLEKIFQSLERIHGMTPTQKMTLLADLEMPQNLADLLPKVNDPEYRSMLIYFGNILAHADGIITEDEEQILQLLHAQQMQDIDAEKLREDIRRDMERNKAELEAEAEQQREAVRGRSPVLGALDRVLKKMGIDMLS